jgi:cytochrome c biogenesis protein CcmG/thiol:disulfide interchange protein DsbE
MKYLLLSVFIFVSTVCFVLTLKFKPQLVPAPLRTKYSLPLVFFVILALFLAIGLKLKPYLLPTLLLNKPAPVFSTSKLLTPTEKFSPTDLKGKVWLFNVWGSWCETCRAEHSVLNEFAKQKIVTLVGLNYKDDADDAKEMLNKIGNPFDIIASDPEGRIGNDWGVYGVPETFVVDKKGVVRLKHTGIISPDDVQTILLPLINQLQAESQ